MKPTSNDPYTIAVIQTRTEFERIQTEWEALQTQATPNSIFLSWKWLYAWWDNRSQAHTPWIVIARKNDKLVGIAPLMTHTKKKYGLKFRSLRSLGSPDTDISNFIVKNQDAETIHALCRYIFSQSRQWDVLEFENYEMPSWQYAIITQTFTKLGAIFEETVTHHLQLKIGAHPWDEFFAKLPKNFRKDIKRRMRRAQEAGRLQFSQYSGKTLTWDIFEAIFSINEFGSYPDLYRNEQETNFLKGLHSSLADQMKVFFLSLDNTPVAFSFGFQMNNRYEDWRSGYDKRHHMLSVGKLLLRHTVEHLHKAGVTEIDFLRGVEYYKERWSPDRNPYVLTRITSPYKLVPAIVFVWLPRVYQKLSQWFPKKAMTKAEIEESD